MKNNATAKVTTATRNNALAVPIQALTVRTRADLDQAKRASEKNSVRAASTTPDPAKDAKDKEEIQGVFVVRKGKADFIQVETGVAGTTDIEVTKGLQAGDEIVTGSYKVLRTLKPGASVKVDNSAPKKEEESS